MRSLINWVFSGKSLHAALNPEKKIKLHGVKFTIRKINPLDHMTGAQVLLKKHDTYQKSETISEPTFGPAQVEKLKTHYRHVIHAGVVSVKCNGFELAPVIKGDAISREAGTIPVDFLMTDWELAESLYTEIMTFTYGKKKLRSLISQKIK